MSNAFTQMSMKKIHLAVSTTDRFFYFKKGEWQRYIAMERRKHDSFYRR